VTVSVAVGSDGERGGGEIGYALVKNTDCGGGMFETVVPTTFSPRSHALQALVWRPTYSRRLDSY